MNYKKKDIYNGVLWSAIDKFSIVAVTLVFEILIARLLSPEDYGIVGMIVVITAIGQVFIEGGFTTALIQKTDRNETDFSTVFYFNLISAIIIYTLIYLLAPYFSNFYEKDLVVYIRIIGLNIVFNAITIVHRAKLSISLNFKSQAKFSIIAVVLSGLIGFLLAYLGFGIWALLLQITSLSFLNAIFLWLSIKWYPGNVFSKNSFKNLFSFGSKLLISSIVQVLYQNFYSVIIGKKFSPADLGLFSKSNQFSLMPISMFTSVLQRVSLPYFSSLQNDINRLIRIYLKYTELICICFFSVILGFVVLAEVFVLIFMSEKWLEIVSVLRLLLLAYIFYPLIVLNMTILQIKGETKAFLKIEILTKVIGLLILFFTYKYGLIVLVQGIFLQQFIQFLITSIYTNKINNITPFAQIKIVLPILFTCAFLFIGVSLIMNFFEGFLVLRGLIGMLLILFVFLVLVLLFMKDEFVMFLKRNLL